MKTVIACSNSVIEAERLSLELNAQLIKSVKRYFSDGEMHVHLDNEVLNNEVLIYQTMNPSPNDALFEALLISDLLKGKKITLIAPWLAYSRQDRQWFNTECLSLKTVCNLLKSTGVSKIITFDVHFHRIQDEFKLYGLEWINLSATKALINHVKKTFNEDVLIIGPDEGSRQALEAVGGEVVFNKKKTCKSCNKSAQECKCKTEKKEYEVNSELTREIKEKNILILDDIISSGGTVLKAIEKLKGKRIAVAVTHAFFNQENFKKLKAKTERLIATNTVRNDAGVIDIVPIITDYFNQ